MSLSIDEQLLPHRNAIDEIDAEILRLLNERAGHAHAIGELKGTGAVYRPEREVAVLRRIQSLNKGPRRLARIATCCKDSSPVT